MRGLILYVKNVITLSNLTVYRVIEQMSLSLMPDLRRVWNLRGRSLTFQGEQKARPNFLWKKKEFKRTSFSFKTINKFDIQMEET